MGKSLRLYYTCSLTHSVVEVCSCIGSLVGPSRAVAVCTSFVLTLAGSEFHVLTTRLKKKCFASRDANLLLAIL